MAITLDNQIIQSLQLLTMQLSSTNGTPTKLSLKKKMYSMCSSEQVVVCSSITLTFLKEIQVHKRSSYWIVSSFWSHRSPNFWTNLVADPRKAPPPPPDLRPNWGPKGSKKIFWDRHPSLSQGLDDRPLPPLSQGLDDRPSPPVISRSGSTTVINLFSLIKLVYRVRASVLLTSSNLRLGSAFELF